MTEKQGELTARELRFCMLEAELGNPKEAAERAGYRYASRKAIQLMRRADIRREIQLWRDELRRGAETAAIAGLRRVAFGGVGDAAGLLTAAEERSAEQLAQLDLFAVQEMKVGRDGACSLRFHDRTRALELLLDYRQGAGEGGGSLFEALDNGARVADELPDDDAL